MASSDRAGLTETLLDLLARLLRPGRLIIASCTTLAATAATLYLGLSYNLFPDRGGAHNEPGALEPDELVLAAAVFALGTAISVIVLVLAAARLRRGETDG